MVVVYVCLLGAKYGQDLTSHLVGYVTSPPEQGRRVSERGLFALLFTGGCMANGLFYAPLAWSRRALICAAALLTLGTLLFLGMSDVAASAPVGGATEPSLAFIVQGTLFAAGGVSVLALCICELWKERDATAVLLAFWVGGTLAFAGFVNWTVNGRSILPMLPAAAILVVRQITRHSHGRAEGRSERALMWPLIPGLALALIVAHADLQLAAAAKAAAGEITARHLRDDRTVWFQGHWGFQYYMEEAGAKSFDFERLGAEPGDVMVIPRNNTNVFGMPADVVSLIEEVSVPVSACATTMCGRRAGFYSSIWGPLPYVFGVPGPDVYGVLAIEKPVSQVKRE